MFDGIDLDELAGLEDGNELNIKNTDFINDFSDNDDDIDNKTKKEEDKNEIILDESNSLALDELIGSEEGEDSEEDETKNKVDKKDTKTPGKDSEQNSSSQETFTFLASALVESGVFSSLEEDEVKEIKDTESLLEAISKQIKTNELKDLSEDQKNYLEAIRTGVNLQNYQTSYSNLEQYKRIDDEKIKSEPRLQFELIRRSLIVDGASEEKARKYANNIVNSDEAEEEALQAKLALIKFEEDQLNESLEKAKLDKQKEKEKADNELAELKSKINSASEIIPGVKINSQTKEKIYTSLTTPVKVNDDKILNEVMEAYQNSDYKMRLHAMHIITNGFKDFSKFNATIKTSAVKQLDEKLKTSSVGDIFSGGGINNPTKGKTSKEMNEALQKIKF